MFHALSGRWWWRRPRRLGRAFILGVVGAVALAAPSAVAAKPIGTFSVPLLTPEPVPITGLTWEAVMVGPQVAFGITRIPDQASPLLFFRMLLGTQATTAQIVVDAKGSTPTTYDLTEVTLTSVSVQTDEKGQLREAIQLHFTSVTITAGGTSKCWDFGTNTPC